MKCMLWEVLKKRFVASIFGRTREGRKCSNQFCLYFKSFADSQTIVRPVNLLGASGGKSVVSSRQIFIWKMSLCQVYSFMPGVVIELTTSALQGLTERTPKCLERLGKSYSFCLWRKRSLFKVWCDFPFVWTNCQLHLQHPIYFIKTLLISPLSQIIIKSRPCQETVIND